MKRTAALIIALCLLLPCVAEGLSLSDFAWNYSLYAGMFGVPEISASDASVVDEGERYHFTLPGGMDVLVRSDMRGGSCIAPEENSDAFVRTCAALFFTVHGTDGIIDFLGTLLFNLLFIDHAAPASETVGNAVYKLTSSDGLLVFSFALIR